MPKSTRRLVYQYSAFALALAVLPAAHAADTPLEYNRDIRPILSENCFACHGPDSASRKANLRLDKREAAIEAKAIIAGDADSSELIARVFSTDAEEVMPPPDSHKSLKPEQKETLKRWVAEGAVYQPHWSFLPPNRTNPPTVKNDGWVRNPIDQFVLSKLEAAGLAPAPEADRRTLARRLSLDLTGLPPEPAAVDAFVMDQAPDAYDKYVESLLNSPAWGEHRARGWLDVARYADTHGYHFDNFREMWTYRDWVIEAFNKNMPFDQFTTEQLAGDLLPNRTIEQQIASGFNRCNMTTNEGGTIAEENLAIYMKDRTETVSQVFLGLTAGCAGCHDHKFDPVTQREYYELAAFFNNSTQDAFDGNIQSTPPIIVVPSDADRPRWESLPTELTKAREAVDTRRQDARPEFDQWLSALNPATVESQIPTEGQKLRASLSSRDQTTEAVVPGTAPLLEISDAGDFDKDQAFAVSTWIKPTRLDQYGSIAARMDDRESKYRGWDFWFENGGRIGAHLVHSWPDDAIKVLANNPVPANQWTHVTLTYDGSGKPEGVKIYYNGKAQPTQTPTNTLKNTIKTTVPFKIGMRHTQDRLPATSIRDLRLFGRAVPEAEVSALGGLSLAAELVAQPPDKRPTPDLDALFAWWIDTKDKPYADLIAARNALETEEKGIRQRGTIAHVMQEKANPAMAYVLFRGDYDKKRDQVNPDTPDILPTFPADQPRNRLGFAAWLLQADHPLTARVTANRFWQEVFGQGLVRSTGDFGITGDLPSHPELLDWLALEFREKGWNMKDFFRLLVSSATYRQAAISTPEKLEKDPKNALLSRGPRFRMDAEMVRDYALASSKLLVERVGGPSVRPYQPDGVWEAVAMPESNTRNYKPDTGAGLYRRSLYTFWKRAAPPADMEIFNAPSRETCTVRRERTNTPLQALVTLNDPQFFEAARHLAELTLSPAGGADEDSKLAFLSSRMLARPLKAEEAAIVKRSLAKLNGFYADHPDEAAQLITVGESRPDPNLDPRTLAGWTMLANELLNLDEALNK